MRSSSGKKRRKILSSSQFCPSITNSGILLSWVLLLGVSQAITGSMACTAFSFGLNLGKVSFRHHSLRQFRLLATSSDSIDSPQRIAILGGGLAGLSTVFHLLEKKSNMEITILDKAPVGKGGASSVAGGLVHPLSPRGKLVHGGRQGLAATKKLVEQAKKYKPDCVLKDELYRVALNKGHVEQLQQTATTVSEYCTWVSRDEMQDISRSQYALGGLRLTNGCKVVHVPTYLEGLWMACQEMSVKNDSTAQWTIVDDTCQDWKERLHEFDAVVLAAGAGLFHHDFLLSKENFPVDLIRGQSIEMTVKEKHDVSEALLCGKYISPLPQDSRLLIGATHEYKAEPLSETELFEDLKERSYELAPNVWDYGTVDKITSGYRVQSRRGALGRAPIIGRLDSDDDVHSNVWIFTGLSSRGLLYHGLHGDILTDAMLGKRNETLWNEWKLDWWRSTK